VITAYVPEASAMASRVAVHGNTLPGSVQRKSHVKRLSYFRAAGFEREKKAGIPYICACHTRRNEGKGMNFDSSTSQVKYGCSCGGQSDAIPIILKPYQTLGLENKPIPPPRFPIIYDSINIQHAIGFCHLCGENRYRYYEISGRVNNVGDLIDALLVPMEGEKWTQRKELHASV